MSTLRPTTPVDLNQDLDDANVGKTMRPADGTIRPAGNVIPAEDTVITDKTMRPAEPMATAVEEDLSVSGDYFILKNDITINTDTCHFPKDFTFTGHLDALDHEITITGKRAYLFDGLNGEYKTAQETDKNATWEANVHLEGTKWVPTLGWRAEVVNTIITGAKLFKDKDNISGYVNNSKYINGTDTTYYSHTPAIPTYKE